MKKILILLAFIPSFCMAQKPVGSFSDSYAIDTNSSFFGVEWTGTNTYVSYLFAFNGLVGALRPYFDTSSGGSPFIDSVRLADTTKLLTHKIDSVAALTSTGTPGGTSNSVQRDSGGFFAGNNDWQWLPGSYMHFGYSGNYWLYIVPGDAQMGDIDNSAHSTVIDVHDASQEIVMNANKHIVLNSDTAVFRVDSLKIPYLSGATQIAADGNGNLYSYQAKNVIVASGEVKGIVNASDTLYKYTVASDTDHSFTVDGWMNITAISSSSMVIQILYTTEMGVPSQDEMNANVGGFLTQIFSAQAVYHCFGMMIRARKGTKIVVLASLNSGAVCTYNSGSTLTNKD